MFYGDFLNKRYLATSNPTPINNITTPASINTRLHDSEYDNSPLQLIGISGFKIKCIPTAMKRQPPEKNMVPIYKYDFAVLILLSEFFILLHNSDLDGMPSFTLLGGAPPIH